MRYFQPTVQFVTLDRDDIITTSLVLPEMPLPRHDYSDTDNVDYGSNGVAEN